MKRTLFTCLLTLACAGVQAPAPVEAASPIQRCVTTAGETVYTDRPCRLLGARSRPMPADLATRIWRDAAHAARLDDAADDDAIAAFAPTSLAPPIARRAVAAGCARSPTQLVMDLRGAFALGDVNRIAESYHWVGVSPRSAAHILQRLEQLARHPVADARYYDAWIGDAATMTASADAGTAGSGGVLQVAFAGADAEAVTDFDVQRYAGCYFVRF